MFLKLNDNYCPLSSGINRSVVGNLQSAATRILRAQNHTGFGMVHFIDITNITPMRVAFYNRSVRDNKYEA